MDLHSSTFRKWRTVTFFSLFIGWGLYLLMRKTLPSSMQNLIQHKGFTKDNVGMIASSFAFSYGISKLVFSFVADHVSPGKLFVSGLLLNGICCIVFPVSSSVTMACIVWFTAGIVQGCGWPACVPLLKSWYPPTQIGTWWSILSGAGNIASGLSPLLILYITQQSDWATSYYLIGISAFIVGCVAFFTIKDSPKDVGMRTGILHKNKEKGKKTSESGGSPWYAVFLYFDLWVVSYLYLNASLVKDGVLGWMQLFLVEVGDKSEAVAAASVGVFQMGGLIGNLVIGYFSDLLLVKRATTCPRAPVLLGLSLLLAGTMHAYRTAVGGDSPEVWLSVVTFSLGFLVDAVIALVGLCSMEIVPHHMAGGAHGVACAVSQGGTVLAGWPFAYVIGHYSWNVAYWIVELFSLSMAAGGLYLLLVMFKGLEKKKQL